MDELEARLHLLHGALCRQVCSVVSPLPLQEVSGPSQAFCPPPASWDGRPGAEKAQAARCHAVGWWQSRGPRWGLLAPGRAPRARGCVKDVETNDTHTVRACAGLPFLQTDARGNTGVRSMQSNRGNLCISLGRTHVLMIQPGHFLTSGQSGLSLPAPPLSYPTLLYCSVILVAYLVQTGLPSSLCQGQGELPEGPAQL